MEGNNKTPLYHGTDMRILKMCKEERNGFKNDCKQAIDYMWKFIQPYNEKVLKTINVSYCPEPINVQESKLYELEPILKDEQDPHLFKNLIEAVSCNIERLNKNSMYLYDYIYFTTDENTALNYASRAWKFGEIGQIAYRFYQAIEKLQPSQWNPSKDILKTIDKLVSFVNEKEQPVIVEFYDYELEYLFTQNGKSVSENNFIGGELLGHFYYTKDVNLNPDKAIPFEQFKQLKGIS